VNPQSTRRSGWVAFQHADYRNYWFADILGVLAVDMQITAISWHVYQLTGDPLSLGLVGLAQFAPFFLLFLVAGAAADRFRRIRILLLTIVIQMVCAVLFFAFTASDNATFPIIFGILIVLGVARAFQGPAQHAIVPVLVPGRHFGNAVAWSSMGGGVSRIAGPGIGGVLLILGEEFVYGTAVVLFALAAIFTFLIKAKAQVVSRERTSLHTVLAGFRFIWSRQVVLGAISLDLFAVLLGGATALLPIYAVDILGVGEVGFGALRVAHVVGSMAAALLLTQRPITRNAGVKLLVAVGSFGAATCVFGLSRSFWLSLGALFALGAADAFSMFVRHNLVQLVTPDEKRGRVSAVASVFTGASNELGEFESGVTAAWWGVVPAVLVGGLGTVAIAIVFWKLFPEMRDVDRLDPDELARRYGDSGG
jgi:MFS family permease